MGMDMLVSAALEEVCARLSLGLPVTEMWTALSSVFNMAGLPMDLAVKRVLFARLIALPVISLVVEGVLAHPPRMDMEEAERYGARLLASRPLRDNFLGIYDHRCSASKLSDIQRKTLELIGASRTSGLTQCSLSKEAEIKGNNFHYVVKTLKSQGLIVGKQAIAKINTQAKRKAVSQDKHVISTNSLYLSRYAKNLNMNSYQRIEITKPKLECNEETNIDALQEDETLSVDYKNDVSIHDYLPAMKAICDKLEEASGKVLAVSDIKKDLSYRMQPGHRAWRNVLHRLLGAQLVEKIAANVDDKIVHCLRLLKRFNPDEFKPKGTISNYKLGKKGLETDQVMELPLDNCIYDMIDAQGPKGITLRPCSFRLGLGGNGPKSPCAIPAGSNFLPWPMYAVAWAGVGVILHPIHTNPTGREKSPRRRFFFQASRSARPPRLLAALGFGGGVRSGRRREVREAALGWRSRSSISPAAAALHPALGRRRSPSSFSRRRSPSRPQPPPVSIPLQPPPPLSFPLSIPASRRRSPSLLPRFGFTGCGRGQGRGQQPGHQEAGEAQACGVGKSKAEGVDITQVMMFGRLSPKASLLQQQQRHLQKKASPKSCSIQKKKVSPKAQQSRASWNPGLEKALVDLLHEHNNPHYRCQNGWTSEAWNKVVKEFRDRHPYVTMNKQQIQDKEKELKRDYRLLKEARKQSGASWDNQRCMIVADDAVWANIITSNEKVRKFSKNKSFPLFESLGELYDGQTAEGNMNFTSIEPFQHATLTQVNEYLERSDSFPDVNWVADDDETTEVQDEDNAVEHENQGSHITITSRANGEKNVKKTKSTERERE